MMYGEKSPSIDRGAGGCRTVSWFAIAAIVMKIANKLKQH